tara:strand:+ start:718 stop:1002 length:285 start_codon:yes stop_codon:yes gene_type:complete
MKTVNENHSTKKIGKYPYMTRHFAKRYYERILAMPVPKRFRQSLYDSIKEDMNMRMLDREKETMVLFSQSISAVVPMARYNSVVVSKNKLITIY